MMCAENGRISRKIVEVIHNDSNEQVQHLKTNTHVTIKVKTVLNANDTQRM